MTGLIADAAVLGDRSSNTFVEAWRRQKSGAFDLERNSTAGSTTKVILWGREAEIYSNANLSVYSAQSCNARCLFCVEELRPASRGVELSRQKLIERNDQTYFESLNQTLDLLAPLNPSVSVTGGEPSKDARLPRILQMLQQKSMRKRTMTTNGSGLLDQRDGLPVIDWIRATAVQHLNISRAHPECEENARLMRLKDGLSLQQLGQVVTMVDRAPRVRLSCVLLKEGISDLQGILAYLEFAQRLGVDNVIFRQLMKTDEKTHQLNQVVEYSTNERVLLEPLLDEISGDARFQFQRQIVGYYYYVEVWKYRGIDVVFEEADLAQLEAVKAAAPDVIHELIYHPNGKLASTWQPWDGVLGPDCDA